MTLNPYQVFIDGFETSYEIMGENAETAWLAIRGFLGDDLDENSLVCVINKNDSWDMKF